ncbi:MAG: CHRD domain-containing protein [Pseudomonadota bacterium]
MFFEMLASLRARLLTTSTLSQETNRDGQTLVNSFFTNTVVEDTPAFVLQNDLSRLLNFGEITTENASAAVAVEGQNVDVFNFRTGRIEANNGHEVNATGIDVTGSADIRNFGEIAGDFNGVSFTGAASSGSLDNFRGGVISSDSRAVDIQGEQVTLRNFGDIVGTGDQRKGTVYTNSTVEEFSISNFTGATIDAGEGNLGAGISLQVGDEVDDVVSGTLFNGFGATIQGRGQAASDTPLAGDGIRIDDGAEGAVLDTDIVNSGLITTESDQGTAAGIRIADGVSAEGQILNTSTGVVEGPRNGLYIGEGEHDLDVRNFGTIQSGSRAVNIDGSGVNLLNAGDILGTGDQRNGTIYSDDTAVDFSITNLVTGVIDAGEGNNGAAISLSLAEDGNGDVSVSNAGEIAGRGQASAAAGTAGDGIRLEGARVEGGFGPALFEGTITNSGSVISESTQGTTGAFRAVNNVNFQGELINQEGGLFAGAQNGVYFGTGDHTGGTFANQGTVTSDSRALNIDGEGLGVVNEGQILGTGDQRNGTVYSDDTAQDFSFINAASGLVDAGEGNDGSGISLSLAEEGNGNILVANAGEIAGRGQASAAAGTAGDGIRLEGVRVDGGFGPGLFEGTITNSGTVTSESTQGTTGAFRAVNNVNFQGSLVNEEDGVFAGAQNGVYFGTGDHSGGSFINRGTVTSDSRALNIDGEGLTVVNEGQILGTGDQRNGTVYVDGTGDQYTFTNAGVVDAGLGNNGSALSIQNGDVDGDIVSAAVFNTGLLQGQGDATEGNTIGDGLRVFSNAEDTGFAGIIQNEGTIAGSEDSDVAAGIRIDGGVNLLGAILNEGQITGSVNAIDAREAGDVTFVNDDEGVVNGNVLLGAGEDILVDLGVINGVIDGGAGDDALIAGDGDNVLVGGLGNDFLDGGAGNDTADFSDLDVAVNVNLGANGNGTATRETGFSVTVEDVVVGASLQDTANINDAAGFVSEAVAGNLYYNIHTSDFPGGEIRGQLLIDSDVTEGNLRTIELSGGLDAAQEPGPTSDSEATGQATLTITQNQVTGEVSYSSELSVTGLNEADLQTPVPGAVSAIHLHNAPAGINGPIAQDTLVDAGATLDAEAPISSTGVVGEDVIDNVTETDVLLSIENVIGSDDADIIIGSDQVNSLNGGDGDDVIRGEGGDDILTGGLGADIFEIGADDGSDIITDFQVGIDEIRLSDFGSDFDLSSAVSSAQQDGADAVLSFGSDATVRLANVDTTLLDEDDFVV